MFVACDESGLNKRFFVIGSVWIQKERLPELEATITDLRLRFKCWGEVKWTKITDSTPEHFVCFYEAFVQAAISAGLSFHCIIVDTEKLDERKMTELLHLKFMYLLLSRSPFRNYFLQEEVQPSQLHILFDQFEESAQSRSEAWRVKTRQFIESHFGTAIEHLQPCDSKINSLLQVVDLFTGLVSQKRNDGAGALSAHRHRLSRILYGCEFNVWDWEPYLRSG